MNKFEVLKGNIFGGITAGVIALPLALAFGIASGLGAVAGLYGAIVLCFFASLFGGTPTQISGPTGPMTVVVATILMSQPENLKLIFVAILFAGLFQIILGLTKVGGLVNYVPYPVISGFMSGIGVIIILLQINQLMGLDFSGTPIFSLFNVFSNLNAINYQSLILGIVSLLIVFFTPKKISRYCPSSLIALFLITLINILLNLSVPVIGTIPHLTPEIQIGLINYTEFKEMLPIALTLAVLGSIDSLLTSVVADSLTKTKHNPNQELIGQGIGNMAASLIGGLAGAGATMRTVVNIKTGGTGKLSGVIHSIFLVSVVLFLAPFVSAIPLSVLAAILIKVGFDIIDYKFLKIIRHIPKYDIFVMLCVFLITVFNDLILAVGVGIVLSSILFAVKSANNTTIKTASVNNYLEENKNEETIILHVTGNFFFGSASFLLSRLETLLKYKTVIIDCKNAINLDISAFFALEDLIIRMNDHGAKVILILQNEQMANKLYKLGLKNLISKEFIKYNIEEAF